MAEIGSKATKSILLIIGGGIAAYKSLELVRLLKKANVGITPILTQSGAEFITPLSLSVLAGEAVRQDLFSLTDESEIGHIRLARQADLVVIAPATANLMARMAMGMADDLATTLLLATDKPILMAPAMNPVMWAHPATKANLKTLHDYGITTIGPEKGDMACGEHGEGRLIDIETLYQAIMNKLNAQPIKALAGKTALVTAGPTHEMIDDVRYIANRSSGKQGYAIANELAKAGANCTLISGPTDLTAPNGVKHIKITTALDMYNAVMAQGMVDIAVMAAAVGDWRLKSPKKGKIKKQKDGTMPQLDLIENPDILKTIAHTGKNRPSLVVGFAAETDKVHDHALKKYQEKGCDWLLLNDVGKTPAIFGGDENEIYFYDGIREENHEGELWPMQNKHQIAEKLIGKMIHYFS